MLGDIVVFKTMKQLSPSLSFYLLFPVAVDEASHYKYNEHV